MYKFFVIFLIVLFSIVQIGKAQTERNRTNDNDKAGIIRGQILERESHKPMSFAQVSVFNLSTDKLVDGAITDKEGNFLVNNLEDGKYYIMIKFIGYEKKKVNSIEISPKNPLFDLGKIELTFSNYQTEGVEVSAEKPLVEFKMDKKVVNVNRDIISQGGSAVDALQNVPSVKVDLEGNITLRGSSNFTVFINGKPSVLTGSDALEQIPAATIENIEIITNPSAKNDPDGVGGIINIVLKKYTELGLTGIFDISVGTRDKYSSNILLNYQMTGFRVFGGFDYRDNIRYNEGETETIYYLEDGNRYIDSDLDGKRKHGGITLKGGMGFDISDASFFSLEGNLGGMEFARLHNSNLKQWYDNNPVDSFFVNKNLGTHNRDYYSVNMNFIHNFDKKGHQLSAMAYYSDNIGGGADSQEDFITDSVWKIIQKSNNNIKSIEDEESNDYRFKLDYVLPFNGEDRFEAGYQLRIENETEKFTLDQFIVDENQPDSSLWVNNPLFTNSYDLNEDIHSIYSTYSAKFNSFSFMAGLRGEYTLRNIDVEKANKIYKIDRVDWFPSLHLVQDLGTSQQVTASYSRRIERPGGWDLEPFPSYMNAFTYRIGNPDLGPEYTDSYEIGFQRYFGVSYIALESYYRVTSDKITRIRTLDTSGFIMLTSTNLNKDYTLGVELTANYEPVKWLRLNASGSYYNYRLEGQVFEEDILKSTNVWDANFNITFMMSQNTRFQTNGFYSGPSITPQGTSEGMFGWNVALRQDFLNKQASLTLQVRDILGTMKREFSSNDALLYNRFYMDFESPVVTLSFSYKLNNYKKKKETINGESGDFDEGF